MGIDLCSNEPVTIRDMRCRQLRDDQKRDKVINAIVHNAITDAAMEHISNQVEIDKMTAAELCLSVIQGYTDKDEPIQYYMRRGSHFYFRNIQGKHYKVWLSESLSKEFCSSVRRLQFINPV